MKRILVVDDCQRHLDAAVQQLSGPDTEVICTTSYREALEMLQAQRRTRFNLVGYAPEQKQEDHQFDVDLCDLLMPAVRNGLGRDGEKHVGLEAPYGMMVMYHAIQAGVRLVAVASAGSHHDHPATAIMDFLNGNGYPRGSQTMADPISMDQSLVLVTNAPGTRTAPDWEFKKDWAAVVNALEAAAASK